MHCPKCGTKAIEDARFCMRCGQELPSSSSDGVLGPSESDSNISSSNRIEGISKKKAPLRFVGLTLGWFLIVTGALAVFSFVYFRENGRHVGQAAFYAALGVGTVLSLSKPQKKMIWLLVGFVCGLLGVFALAFLAGALRYHMA